MAAIWWRERRPPSLGETAEWHEALAAVDNHPPDRSAVGRELVLAVIGIGALAAGSVAIVEAVIRGDLVDAEARFSSHLERSLLVVEQRVALVMARMARGADR